MGKFTYDALELGLCFLPDYGLVSKNIMLLLHPGADFSTKFLAVDFWDEGPHLPSDGAFADFIREIALINNDGKIATPLVYL